MSDAIDLITRHEGFSATPYLCPAGIATIGYGTTHYPNGTAVELADPACTEPQARQWLAASVAAAERSVDHMVTVPLSPGQRVALVDFVYNLGAKALSGSILLRKLHAGDDDGAAGELGKWVHAGGKILPGLVKRRAEEATLFVRPA